MNIGVRDIRTARDADLPRILDLYAQAGLGGSEQLDLDAAKAMLRQFEAYPNYRLFVAVDAQDHCVGTYALLIMDNIAHKGRPLAIVEQVAVDVDVQGKGIGTAMMQHAMAEARNKNCYKLGLSSNAAFTRAHEFYEKLGFQRHGYSFHVDIM